VRPSFELSETKDDEVGVVDELLFKGVEGEEI
jgi:hypothetical protein